jgi:hypothetical protein
MIKSLIKSVKNKKKQNKFENRNIPNEFLSQDTNFLNETNNFKSETTEIIQVNFKIFKLSELKYILAFNLTEY